MKSTVRFGSLYHNVKIDRKLPIIYSKSYTYICEITTLLVRLQVRKVLAKFPARLSRNVSIFTHERVASVKTSDNQHENVTWTRREMKPSKNYIIIATS